MSLAAAYSPPAQSPPDCLEKLRNLKHQILEAAHLLPSQGPITVFIHHNTLHAFEDKPFDEAILEARRLYGAEPYLSEARYRHELQSGRIQPQDLHSVLLEELDDQADVLIGCLGTRHELHLAMLRYPLRDGTDTEIRWFIHEADALLRFRSDVAPLAKRRLMESTKRWVRHDVLGDSRSASDHARQITLTLVENFDVRKIEKWSEPTWESLTLQLLWQLSSHGVADIPFASDSPSASVRHRDALLEYTGFDSDLLVNSELTRYCAAYLDQGYAGWQLPKRDEGFFTAYCELVCGTRPAKRWLRGLPAELARLRECSTPIESVAESLALLGVSEAKSSAYIAQSLLALRGWAGTLWQMETNGQWTVRPAREGTLIEYLAVRLILERLAITHIAAEHLGYRGPLSELRTRYGAPSVRTTSNDRCAFQVFQLAQLRSWSPAELDRLSESEWRQLVNEIESFDETRRRKVYHLAYERRYRNQTLDALAIFSQRHPEHAGVDCPETLPAYQVICCLDDREESFRRHLEEVEPEVETFGIAGFFGVAMYYRGATEAHYRPLCPITIKPRHYVSELPVFSIEGSAELQQLTRRRFGRLWHHLHLQTRTAAGGIITGLLGSITSLPMVLRILFPRLSARISDLFHSVVIPLQTQLHLERIDAEPGPHAKGLGYSVDEMADIVESGLRAIGLNRDFAPLVFVMGHGSSSLNNPHEAAYDCGACGGGPGGPNARAFAAMANEPRVRYMLGERGLEIPHTTYFVGAFHNTCDDTIGYSDLVRLPQTKWSLFNRARQSLEEARSRDAHERCRRFESAPVTLTPQGALRHVETRSEDLSQVRPEYCHATNAVCIVGRRSRTQGLFLDRRAFLTSYDPMTDDADHTILAGVLAAVVPVCAGISLEYYFSAVDNVTYGCGSKLPHNLTAQVGVMEGAESDLRTGLSAQMVEIHEPMRILFVVETSPEAMLNIMACNPAVNRLVRNEWIQLCVLDPDGDGIQRFVKGKFEPYYVEEPVLPTVARSADWYLGCRKHLRFAEIARSRGAVEHERGDR